MVIAEAKSLPSLVNVNVLLTLRHVYPYVH